MTYTIEYDPRVERDLKKLPLATRELIVDAIEDLGEDPRPPGVRKLKGKKGLWRITEGKHRIIYGIQDKKLLVIVVTVGPRKNVYDR